MEQHPIEKLQEEIAHYMSRNDELQSLYQDEHCEVLRLQNTLDEILNIINKAKGDK